MFDFVINNFGKIILALSGIIFGFLVIRYFQRIRKFIGEVIVELGKVSWPTRAELISATWVVIFSTAMLAVFIFVADTVLSKILSLMVR